MKKLKNIELAEISIVSKPAHKKPFLFTKSDEDELWPSFNPDNYPDDENEDEDESEDK